MAKILYIEDDKLLREITEQVLLSLGHSVLVRVDAHKADDIVDNWKPDLVITDHDLGCGKETGLELAKRLHATNQKVAVLSGSPGAFYGATESNISFFYKPFCISDLLEEMNIK